MSSQAAIEKKAYELWQSAGCPEGRDLEFWSAAEKLLSRENLEKGLEESFPASDPHVLREAIKASSTLM